MNLSISNLARIYGVCFALAANPVHADDRAIQSLDSIRAAAGAIAYTGLISVGVGYTTQVVAQRHTHEADAALLLSSETVFAAFFGAVLAGDRLAPAGWAGCALILACILAAQAVPLLARKA